MYFLDLKIIVRLHCNKLSLQQWRRISARPHSHPLDYGNPPFSCVPSRVILRSEPTNLRSKFSSASLISLRPAGKPLGKALPHSSSSCLHCAIDRSPAWPNDFSRPESLCNKRRFASLSILILSLLQALTCAVINSSCFVGVARSIQAKLPNEDHLAAIQEIDNGQCAKPRHGV